MALSAIASGLTEAFVNQADEISQNTTQNLKDHTEFSKKSQDAQTKAGQSTIAAENTKTVQNKVSELAKGYTF